MMPLELTELIGFGEGEDAAGITWTFVGSATSSLSTVDISSTGRLAGDLGVLLDYSRGDASPTSAVTPSGHTQAATVSDNSPSSRARASITFKLLTGSEGSLAGMGGTSPSKIYFVFRPSKSVLTVAYSAGGAVVTAGNPSAQTIDPSAESAAIVVGLMASSGTVSPRTTSPTMNEVAGAATNHYAHHLISNSSPPSQSYDMDDEGNDNAMMSGYFTFT